MQRAALLSLCKQRETDEERRTRRDEETLGNVVGHRRARSLDLCARTALRKTNATDYSSPSTDFLSSTGNAKILRCSPDLAIGNRRGYSGREDADRGVATMGESLGPLRELSNGRLLPRGMLATDLRSVSSLFIRLENFFSRARVP